MRSRRITHVPTSDDEDDAPLQQPRDPPGDENQNQRKRKKVHLSDEEDEREVKSQGKRKKKEEKEEPEPEDEEQEDAVAQPMGEVVRVSGKGRGRRNHYESFELDGLQYHLVS